MLKILARPVQYADGSPRFRKTTWTSHWNWRKKYDLDRNDWSGTIASQRMEVPQTIATIAGHGECVRLDEHRAGDERKQEAVAGP